MGKAAAITAHDSQYKAKALSHLSEAKRILSRLSSERQRASHHRHKPSNLISEVKAILHGA